MGNSESVGIAVINKTNLPVTIGLSVGATFLYENYVEPNEIFYRYPGGAITTMTAYAYATSKENEMTNGTCWKEGMTAGLTAGVVTAAAAATAFTGGAAAPTIAALSGPASGLILSSWGAGAIAAELAMIVAAAAASGKAAHTGMQGLLNALKDSKLETSMMNCWYGGSGTWLALTGGPIQVRNEATGDLDWVKRDFKLEVMDKEDMWKSGAFTEYSFSCFYNGTKGLPEPPKNESPPPPTKPNEGASPLEKVIFKLIKWKEESVLTGEELANFLELCTVSNPKHASFMQAFEVATSKSGRPAVESLQLLKQATIA